MATTPPRAPSRATLSTLQSNGLLDKLARAAAGRQVRCSVAGAAMLRDLAGLPVVATPAQATRWRGHHLTIRTSRDLAMVTAWLARHGPRKPPKTSKLRQQRYAQRAREKGLRRLNMRITPQAAQDLNTIVAVMKESVNKFTKRAAVEAALSAMATTLVLRKRERKSKG